METEYIDGQKVTYDIRESDGFKENYTVHTDVTVIDGVEYQISSDAPYPLKYGVEEHIISFKEGAGIEATYEVYNYITDTYETDVRVPEAWYVDCEPYKPSPEATDSSILNTDGHNWRDDDYKRNIKPPGFFEQ